MPKNPLLGAGLIAACLAGLVAITSNAGAQDRMSIDTTGPTETAVFAGGCFWCVESDFDKVDGVLETISGYTGGTTDAPTYATHKRGKHLEVVRVTYDPELVSYETLVNYFFRHIDPTDAGGQFCDRGTSYTTAVFAVNEDQADIAKAEISAIEASGVLDMPVVTDVRDLTTFYPAEGYHQDYYLKNPLQYKFYREGCRRDATIARVWANEAEG